MFAWQATAEEGETLERGGDDVQQPLSFSAFSLSKKLEEDNLAVRVPRAQ